MILKKFSLVSGILCLTVLIKRILIKIFVTVVYTASRANFRLGMLIQLNRAQNRKKKEFIF